MDVQKIKEIIAKYAKIDVANLNEASDLKKDLHLDSIDLFQIILDVENALGIKIPDSELLDIHTVKDALDKIKNAK